MSADHQLPEPDRFTGAIRKQASRAERNQAMRWWHGLGVLGVIGWMVVVPTLAGIAMGRGLDSRFDTGIFWTLSLLLAGLALGCIAAWRSVKESLR